MIILDFLIILDFILLGGVSNEGMMGNLIVDFTEFRKNVGLVTVVNSISGTFIITLLFIAILDFLIT